MGRVDYIHNVWRNINLTLPIQPQEYDMKNSHRRVLEPFEFEKIDLFEYQKLTYKWQPVVNWIALGYLIFVFIGPRLMRDRKPYDCRRALIAWNWILAIFSLAGTVRMAPTLFTLVFCEPDGYYKSICQREFGWEPEAFWAFAYTVSKIFELLDTVFIVLRKSPLIFLHWYHHVSMLLFMFYLLPVADPLGRWNIVMNYSVHAIMYTYYAIRSMGIRVPKTMSQSLTSIQMFQFITCIIASCRAVYLKLSGARSCILHPMTVLVQLIGGLSYLALFANFFIQTYVFNSKKTTKVKNE